MSSPSHRKYCNLNTSVVGFLEYLEFFIGPITAAASMILPSRTVPSRPSGKSMRVSDSNLTKLVYK